MRISDWSSDVCSSDLRAAAGHHPPLAQRAHDRPDRGGVAQPAQAEAAEQHADRREVEREERVDVGADIGEPAEEQETLDEDGRQNQTRPGRSAPAGILPEHPAGAALPPVGAVLGAPRSEENTSELQSLMRTSYAVFCLKNK